MKDVSARVRDGLANTGPVIEFLTGSEWARRQQAGESMFDFVVGNPHEMPVSGFADSLQKWAAPQNKDWYAYKTSEPESRAIVARTLNDWRGVRFDEADICMTNGGFGGLQICLNGVVDPGDEVIINTPPWFFYEVVITSSGGTAVRVPVMPGSFDLDVEGIDKAITPRTRAIIVNSPNNPTGKIYSPETLKQLASVLEDASRRSGRTIYLLSDEAYSRIVFDGQTFHSPTSYYAESFLIYTYGKTLLTPGQRIGYIALPPTMPDRESMRNVILMAQLMTGFAFPNALLQHALPDLERLSIDIEHLQEKRDRMVSSLSEMGYDLHSPQGTFYLLPRSPVPDDQAFLKLLAEQNVYCLPGSVIEMPGTFRISLTANDAMIDGALPGFKAALDRARA